MSMNFKNGKEHIYDMIIVGGGPAGYTTAIYAARAGFDAVVIEMMSPGGQMALTNEIDNYPGFENGIDGFTLGEKMKKGAERFGVKSIFTKVRELNLSGEIKKLSVSSGKDMYARSIVIATGARRRELGLPREKELIGRGVSYCASCDGMFFKDKSVLVVGGGNSAAIDALLLCRVCKNVILIHRKSSLRATKIYKDLLMQKENLTFYGDSTLTEILGDDKVCGARIRDVRSGEERVIECEGIFIAIGRIPASDLVIGKLKTDDYGYISADESTKTEIEGVFAAGDVRTKAVRQIVSAVADGAAAVHYAEEYLSRQKQQ